MHRRSTLSSPVASVLIGILLPPVSRITPLVFSLLTLMLDIDRVSLVSAQASIDRNGLSERIALLRVDLTGPIRLPLMQNTAASCVPHSTKSYPELTVESIFDFSVCNSPFYACTEEATRTAAAMELLPSAVCSLVPTIPKQHLKYHITVGLHRHRR
jgi:23S rRNA A1618 N6-methylase RlmF